VEGTVGSREGLKRIRGENSSREDADMSVYSEIVVVCGLLIVIVGIFLILNQLVIVVTCTIIVEK